MHSRLRESDTVARLGGDEFTVILPAVADLAAAMQVAEALIARLAEPFLLTAGAGRISASIGLALYPLHTENAEALVQYADTAMYAAKQAGKNQLAVWRPPAEISS